MHISHGKLCQVAVKRAVSHHTILYSLASVRKFKTPGTVRTASLSKKRDKVCLGHLRLDLEYIPSVWPGDAQEKERAYSSKISPFSVNIRPSHEKEISIFMTLYPYDMTPSLLQLHSHYELFIKGTLFLLYLLFFIIILVGS